ncbi:MAG: hypothetical protein U1E76_07005 [Planctomycetota bacterium]
MVALDELKTTVELIGSAIPGPYPLQARSVEFPDAVQTVTVLMNPLSFSFPSVIQLPGQDQQAVYGDLAFAGPDDAGKLHVFVGFIRPGQENFVRRYALDALAQSNPSAEITYTGDGSSPVFYIPASYPTDPPQAVRVAGDRVGNGYWLEPGPQPNDTRDAAHVNNIMRLKLDDQAEAFSCNGLCELDLDSDIAIDALGRIYVLGREKPTDPAAILRIDDAFSPAASARVVVPGDAVPVTPRFALDDSDRLLVLLEHTLRRYRPQSTDSGVPYEEDTSFRAPTFVAPTNVDTDASGLIYVSTRELIDDLGTDSADNTSSIHVINEVGSPVWSLCQLTDPITGDGADFNAMQRVLSFAVDDSGCLFLFDDVNWPDDPTGDGGSSANVVRIDPAEAQGGETSDACGE